ncbi:hypothetical protein [Parasphingorhabdus cellanae]|uniref:Methyltransferase domain-containing protein n=1 Tax=Parasphingorhabdus cellanae TaxID=2806553 RepID=A0ABX7T2T9_9SPHN|nr:hypothetical protein [Parasphingorhabdus cellanae]QTD54854.1 hypothetical protein J4G78_11400 [Parasphingorhabdus cellanae]
MSKKTSLRGLVKNIVYGNAHIDSHLVPLLKIINKKIDETGAASVLDIGGGFGDNYFMIASALGAKANCLSYHVVDNARSCKLGVSLFPEVTYSTDIPESQFDIVAVVGTLQYIKEWQEAIATLKQRAHILYVARTPIRISNQSFYTQQAVCPEYGESAMRKVGVANLSVISKHDLMSEMSDWQVVLSKHHRDYAKHFGRLPSDYRDVAYINFAWKNGEPATDN